VGVPEVWAGHGGSSRLLRLPDPVDEVVPSVAWGSPAVPNTPAYWAVRCRWEDDLPDYVSRDCTLPEEVGFCILGGFGIRYEVNVAAFERLAGHGVFSLEKHIETAEIERFLKIPLVVNGKQVRYRFPNQRARRLSGMRGRLGDFDFEPMDALTLRSALQAIEGIGPKTASWIVRNWLGSDDVAIIDVHILRACRLMGVFPENITMPRDYI
jgi:thermostable 8-oxoguanine DNA glycosylase